MDIQVLNEIANQTRQASFSQARFPVSANAQVKTLKGNPAAPAVEDSRGQGQDQDPITPDISSVARAASVYSATVGEGLNPDELNAIQNLAGKVRAAVSEFLNQPDLEQANSASVLVALNPEAVQNLTSSVEQAVEETFSVQGAGDEATVTVSPSNADLSEKKTAQENLISIERITKGAESNSPVVAKNPTAITLPVSVNTNVENPATEVSEPQGDFRVTPASPTLQNAPASESAPVETPVNQGVAVSPQESANPPEVAAVSQKPASGSETVSTNPQEEVPLTAFANPVFQRAPASESAPVETPVNQGVAVSPQESANPPEVAAVSQESARSSETVSTNPQEEVPLTAVANPVFQRAPASESAPVETPVSRSVAAPRQESVSSPEAVSTNPQEAVPVTAVTSPASQNTPATENAPAGTLTNHAKVVPGILAGPQGSEEGTAQTVNSGEAVVLPEGRSTQTASGQSNPQAVPSPQPGPAQVNDLFAQKSGTVNAENVRDVNQLVGSVVSNEFKSEAKKIFSEPKVIRTVADLADFILERLREMIAAKQQQPSSDNEVGIS